MISEPRNIAPATAGARRSEPRHIARKVVGRPVTASLRTAGQSAAMTAMPSIPMTRSSTNTVTAATTTGTTCSRAGSSPYGGSKTGSRCGYTAAAAMPTTRAMTGRARACTAAMTPRTGFQWRRMVENDPLMMSPRASGRRGITPGCGAVGTRPPHCGGPPQPPPYAPGQLFCVMPMLRMSSPGWKAQHIPAGQGHGRRIPRLPPGLPAAAGLERGVSAPRCSSG